MKRKTDEDKSAGTELGVPRFGSRRISLSSLKTFSSFAIPAYRLYFGGMVGMTGAMNMEMVTRSLLIYRLTGSAAILGVMSLASALPMLFLSLFGGVIADRVQKKHVMLAGQIGSAIVSLGIALTLATRYLSPEHVGSWWVLIAASLLKGTIQGLMMPSRQAILYELVGEERLMNAVALGTLEMNALRFLLPALAGFLIDAFDFAVVYYVVVAMDIMAATFIAFMPLTSTMTIGGGGVLDGIRKGFKYIRQETIILLILLFTVLIVVLSMPYQMLLPIFADDILKVGAKGMGILMSVSGFGASLGSLVLASLPNKKRGLILLTSSLLLAVALVAFSFSRSWYPSLVFIAIVGLGQTGRMAMANALLQQYTTDEYRGRVMSVYMMEFGLTSFGTFGAGLLAEAVGVQWALGGFSLVLVLVAILALIYMPKLRKLD